MGDRRARDGYARGPAAATKEKTGDRRFVSGTGGDRPGQEVIDGVLGMKGVAAGEVVLRFQIARRREVPGYEREVHLREEGPEGTRVRRGVLDELEAVVPHQVVPGFRLRPFAFRSARQI